MRVGIATDHVGFHLKEPLPGRLKAAGHEVVDFGTDIFVPSDHYFHEILSRHIWHRNSARPSATCAARAKWQPSRR